MAYYTSSPSSTQASRTSSDLARLNLKDQSSSLSPSSVSAVFSGNDSHVHLKWNKKQTPSTSCDESTPELDSFQALCDFTEKDLEARVLEVLREDSPKPPAGYNGNTPLHFAAANGNETIVQRLLEMGADPNACNQKKETPMIFAIREGKSESVVLRICQLLLDSQADPFIQTCYSRSAIHLAEERGFQRVLHLLDPNITVSPTFHQSVSIPRYRFIVVDKFSNRYNVSMSESREIIDKLQTSLQTRQKMSDKMKLGPFQMDVRFPDLICSSRKTRNILASATSQTYVPLQKHTNGYGIPESELDCSSSRFPTLSSSSGVYFKATWKNPNFTSDVPVLLKKTIPNSPRAIEALVKEAETLMRLNNPYILKCFGFAPGDEPAVILEYATDNLETFVKNNGALELRTLYSLGSEMASGLNYLHSRANLIHGNLSTRHILLVDNNGQKSVKIGGLHYCSNANSNCSSNAPACYAPPETFMGAPNSTYADIYSFAMILVECLNGEQPFQGAVLFTLMEQVLDGKRPELSPHCPEALKRLITSCWAQEPEARPPFSKIQEVLEDLAEKKIEFPAFQVATTFSQKPSINWISNLLSIASENSLFVCDTKSYKQYNYTTEEPLFAGYGMNNNQFCLVHQNGLVEIKNAESKQTMSSFQTWAENTTSNYRSCAISPDFSTLAVCDDFTLSVYDLRSPDHPKQQFVNQHQFVSCSFHPTSPIIIASNCDNSIKFWNYGKSSNQLSVSADVVFSQVGFFNNGFFGTTANNRIYRWFNTHNPPLIQSINTQSVATASVKGVWCTISEGNKLEFKNLGWDAPDPFSWSVPSDVMNVCFDHSGSKVAIVSQNGCIQINELASVSA